LKVIIAVYQELIDDHVNNSAANVLNLLGRDLLNNNMLKVMFFSKTTKNTIKKIKAFNFAFLIFRYVTKILNRFTSISTHLMRHYLEIAFDLMLSFRLLFINGDLFITTNAWIPLSCSVLRRKGITTILIAGNQNDNVYLKVIQDEKKKIGIKSLDAFDYLPRNKKYNKCLKNIDRIICFNYLIKESYTSDIQFYEKDYDVIESYFPPNYNELIMIEPVKSNNEFRVGYMAHSTVLKGLHILLDAWNKASLPNSTLYIAGSIEDEYKNYISKVFLNKNVKFLGRIKDKKELYNNIDLFVCPSILDASPTTIIEAMHCKIPVLLSSGVGNKFLIKDGYNGYIYKNDDVTDHTQKLILMYNNRNQLKEMGINAYNMITKSTSNSVSIDQLKNIIFKKNSN
jgi:glycosyltransferase involved in cell wall biosynthesis